MGLLSPNYEEHEYLSSAITEAMFLIGQPAKLYQINSLKKDFYQDPEVSYLKSIDVNVIFSDNPKPTLKKFNWFREEEDLPYVVKMTSKAEDYQSIILQDYLMLEIYNQREVQTKRQFQVTNVRLAYIDSMVYICKLVPLPKRIDVKEETFTPEDKRHVRDGISNSYLKR